MSIGKGIQLSTGFDVNTAQPLDSRQLVDSLEERDALINVYNGLRCYVNGVGEFRYIDGEWENVTEIGSSSADRITIKDEGGLFKSDNIEDVLIELDDADKLLESKINEHLENHGNADDMVGQEVHIGVNEPIDENITLWIDTSSNQITSSEISDLIINELRNIITSLQNEVNQLKGKISEHEARILYLEIYGGNGGSGGDAPDTSENLILTLEDGTILTFEDGSEMIFEDSQK